MNVRECSCRRPLQPKLFQNALGADSTLLSTLNAGLGVKGLAIDGKPDLKFTLSNGVMFDVALDGATTLGQVQTKIRAAVPVSVGTAGFDVRIAKDHLTFTDKTAGDAGGFSIKAVDGSLVGLGSIGLGILASIDKPDKQGNYIVEGVPLHGDTLANHMYLVAAGANVPKLTGTATLTAADVDAKGNLKLVPVTLGNGSAATPAGTGASNQTFSATFKDPNNNGKLTFSELQIGRASCRERV